MRPRVEWSLAGLLLVAHAALAWLTRVPYVLTGEDPARYLLLARSLRHLSYTDPWTVGAPVHQYYPPGYPAMLALWGALTGDRLDATLLFGIACSVAALALVYVVVRRLWSAPLALLVLAALAFNPFLLERANQAASEAPFMLLTGLVAWALATTAPSRGRLVLAGAAAGAAALTRMVGRTIVIALAVHWLLERRYRTLGWFALAASATAGAWLAWQFLAPVQDIGISYAADFTQPVGRVAGSHGFLARIGLRVIQNVPGYLTSSMPEQLAWPGIAGVWIDNAVSAGVSTLGLVAGLVVLWRRWRLAALYILATGGLLAVWPWQVGRYLEPVVPFLVLAVFAGLGLGMSIIKRPRWALPATVAVTLALLAGSAQWFAPRLRAAAACRRSGELPPPSCLFTDQASFFDAVGYVREHVDRGAVFLTAKSATFFYYTGNQSVQAHIATAQPAERFVPWLRAQGAQYVLLGSLLATEPNALSRLVSANCDSLSLVEPFPPRTYLFRVGSAADGGRAACAAAAAYREANKNRNFEVDR